MIQNHVTSLELSQEMKALGFPQKSIFNWVNHNGFSTEICLGDPCYDGMVIECSAYLSSELGEMIGRIVNEWTQGWNDSGCFWHFKYGQRGCGSMIAGLGKEFSALDEETEPDARAKILIHLAKEGIIDLKKL